MSRIVLELESLKIHRPKRRWRLYFVVVVEHPEDAEKMIIIVLPKDDTIRLLPPAKNIIDFEPEGEGVDGLTVLERDMPADRRVKVRMYLRHSRKAARSVGSILESIQQKTQGDIVNGLLGITGSALVVAKIALDALTGILKDIPDRDFGFVSMDEQFGPEFENQEELDRANKFSAGQADVVWSWGVKD